MANNLSSNTTNKVVRTFLKAFESSRVLTKTINTQLLEGEFTPQFGSEVNFKRPHQYNVLRTPSGDISGGPKSDIIAGNAKGTVQQYFTAATEFTNLEEAIELDQLEDIIAPAARQIVTDLEVDLGKFMVQNVGQTQGTVGTGVGNWSDVAGANALLDSVGVPKDSMWFYVLSPFNQVALADQQHGLAASDETVKSAWENARISKPLAGMQALSSNALFTFQQGDTADRDGTLSATPDGTYVGAKDTMTQTLALTGLTIGGTIAAGEVLEFTGVGALARTRLNISTRQPVLDAAGAAVKWRATVVTGVTLDGSGDGVITVASAAINEADGQYNNISVALTSGDLFTILGTAEATVQPNLFYHEQAFGIGTVKIPKLFSTDTRFTTEDGFSIRMSMYSDGDKNEQKIRFDLLPAYAVFNPSFGGQGWGA